MKLNGLMRQDIMMLPPKSLTGQSFNNPEYFIFHQQDRELLADIHLMSQVFIIMIVQLVVMLHLVWLQQLL